MKFSRPGLLGMRLKPKGLHGGIARVGLRGLDDGDAPAYFQSHCCLLQARQKVPLQMAYIDDLEVGRLIFPIFVTHALSAPLIRYSQRMVRFSEPSRHGVSATLAKPRF